jgi:hypothetical protein
LKLGAIKLWVNWIQLVQPHLGDELKQTRSTHLVIGVVAAVTVVQRYTLHLKAKL